MTTPTSEVGLLEQYGMAGVRLAPVEYAQSESKPDQTHKLAQMIAVLVEHVFVLTRVVVN
jgi:hypothetical protein